MDALITAADGDLRRAITLLQSISRLLKDSEVTRDDVLELTGVTISIEIPAYSSLREKILHLQYIPDEEIISFLDTCKLGDYDHVQTFVQQLIYAGYGAGQLFTQLQETILESDILTDDQKAIIIERLAISDHRLMDGADEFLQMMDVSASVMESITS